MIPKKYDNYKKMMVFSPSMWVDTGDDDDDDDDDDGDDDDEDGIVTTTR